MKNIQMSMTSGLQGMIKKKKKLAEKGNNFGMIPEKK